MVVVAARAVVVAAVLGLVAVDEVALDVQRVLVVVAALRANHVVELAAALVRVVFLCGCTVGRGTDNDPVTDTRFERVTFRIRI